MYVSGLPKNITQPDLEAIFDSYGRIITSRILSDSMTGSTTIIFYAFILSDVVFIFRYHDFMNIVILKKINENMF